MGAHASRVKEKDKDKGNPPVADLERVPSGKPALVASTSGAKHGGKKDETTNKSLDPNTPGQKIRKPKKTDLPLVRFVLTGMPGSGKSTIIKQLIWNYIKNNDSRSEYVSIIRQHVLNSIKALCKEDKAFPRERIPEEFIVENANPDQKMTMEMATTMGRHIEAVWKDPGVQANYKRRLQNKSYQLAVKPYLDKVMEIYSNTYLPTEQDVLMLYSPTSRPEEIAIELENFKALVVEVSGKQRKHAEQWVMGAHAILFVVDTSDFKAMPEALDFFELVSNVGDGEGMHHHGGGGGGDGEPHPPTPIVLVLNKRDALHERLAVSSLHECFEDFEGLPGKDNTVEHALEFIQMKFESMYHGTQSIMTHTMCALEPQSVLSTVNGVREFILRGSAPPPPRARKETRTSKRMGSTSSAQPSRIAPAADTTSPIKTRDS